MARKGRKMARRIKWTYDHALGGGVYTTITKSGNFVGLVKHTARHWEKMGAEQMAIVQFDGNKRKSRVPLKELKEVG